MTSEQKFSIKNGRFPHSWFSNVRVALWLQRSYTSLTLPFAMVCFILPFKLKPKRTYHRHYANATLNVPPRLFSTTFDKIVGFEPT